jgi:EpsG family
MLLFFLIFTLLSALTLIESFKVRAIPPIVAVFVFLLLSIFAAIRPPEAVADYQVYLSYFALFDKPATYFSQFSSLSYFEPFYYLVPSVLRFSFGLVDYGIISIYIYAFLGCGITMLALRHLTHFYYATILTFFCNYYLLHEMTQIRTAIAVGFFLFAIYYKGKRDFIAFSVCVITSIMFHYSSFFALLILFFSEKSINKKIYFSLALLCIPLSFINFEFLLSFLNFDLGALSVKQNSYVNNVLEETINRRSILYLIAVLDTIVLIMLSDKIFVNNKYIYLLLKIQVCGLIVFQLFSGAPIIAARLSEYLLSSYIVCLSCLLYIFRIKFWVALGICILNLGYLSYFLLINKIIDFKYYV